MTKTPIAIALSLVLAAAAGSSIAGGDMKTGTSARSTSDATMPAASEHTNATLGQASGVRAETRGEMKAEQRVDQRADVPLTTATPGETGRGQGSGAVMSNRGEDKAQMRDDRRGGAPVRKAATGETGKGQGSGLRKEDVDAERSAQGMKAGKDSSGAMTR